MNSIVEKCLVILVMAVVLLSGWSAVALGADAPEWTIDIAQQLLAEGWEKGPQTVNTAVVGYAIHFVELERSQAMTFGLDFHHEMGGENPGLWAVTAADPDLEVRLDNSSSSFTASVKSSSGHKNETASLDSWLLTTEGKPLQVDISSSRLPKPNGEYREDRLSIAILPIRLHSDGKIRTEISLSYETLSGTMAQLHTTALIGDGPEEPIAVVSREVRVGRRVEYQYFAVYLAGMQIPSELIPKDAAFVPMGSIVGLQQFMEESSETRPAQVFFGVSYGDGSFGYLMDGSVPLGQKHRIYGELSSHRQTVYLVGVEGALNQDLHLAAEISSVADGQAVLRIGLRDELQLGEDLQLSVAVLPIRFSLGSSKPKLVVNWRIMTEYSREGYGLFYRLDNDLDRIRHNLGVCVMKDTVGARLSWSWDEVNRSVVTVGIELRY